MTLFFRESNRSIKQWFSKTGGSANDTKMTLHEADRLITMLYRGILRREPESTEKMMWADMLAKGVGPAQVAEAFVSCEEFQSAEIKLFVPPGHYYSPIARPAETREHLNSLQSKPIPDSLPGLTIDRAAMVATWRELAPLMASAPFRSTATPGLRYSFDNPAYSWADGSVLHAMIRLNRPNRIVEVGSGWSSACTLDTVEGYLDDKCHLTFIEPYPQLLYNLIGSDATRVRIIESPVQRVSLDIFDRLNANDILFIDSTHVMRTGSDVCFELFDILPRLNSGVLVHFHDIFWPFEYPYQWAVEENRSWNELYAVRAFLINNQLWRVVMFNHYFATFERALIESTVPHFLKNSGGALWLQKL